MCGVGRKNVLMVCWGKKGWCVRVLVRGVDRRRECVVTG